MTDWQPFVQNLNTCRHIIANQDKTFGFKRLSDQTYLEAGSIKHKEELVKIVIFSQSIFANFQNDYFVCGLYERADYEKYFQDYLPSQKVAILFNGPFRAFTFDSYLDLAAQLIKDPDFEGKSYIFQFFIDNRVYFGEASRFHRNPIVNSQCPCCRPIPAGTTIVPRRVQILADDHVIYFEPFLASITRTQKL